MLASSWAWKAWRALPLNFTLNRAYVAPPPCPARRLGFDLQRVSAAAPKNGQVTIRRDPILTERRNDVRYRPTRSYFLKL